MRIPRSLRQVTGATAVALLCAAAPAAAAPLPASGTLDLADGADATLAGGAAGDLAGLLIKPAGDVNGDGRPDLLVGAPNADPRGREDAGVVYVVFGGALDGVPKQLDQLGTRGLRIEGAAVRDRTGVGIAAAGDVDADGLGDLLVGAPRADGRGADDAGVAYLVRGGREAGTLDLSAPSPRVTTLATGVAGDEAGQSVDSVPDLDGDGRPEVAVGAPRADASAASQDGGSVFVVPARSLDGAASVDLEGLGDRGLRLDGPAGGRAGFVVAGAPDANGDGRGDVLVGAPLSGETGGGYVVFGRPEPGRIALSALGAGGYAVTGGVGDELLGAGVAAVGDPNGDAVPDFAFAAPAADRNERADSGSVHVIPGKADAAPVAVGAAGRPGFRIDGAAAGDRLGATIAGLGDWNGDGRSELVMTAPDADALSREDSGAGFVVFGQEKPADLDLSGLADGGVRLSGATSGAHLRSAAGIGDLDGDRVADLVTGAYGGGAQGAGEASLVLGPKPVPPPANPDPGLAEEVAAGCKAITNVQVIVDDSKSMNQVDPEELRRQAIGLMLTKPRNEGKVVGVFEFGSFGRQLFPPQVVQPRGRGSNQPLLLGSLQQGITADNGGTDYNAAFKGAADDNPGAQARIFITDGGHRAGKYLSLHKGGAPVYPIGLGLPKSTSAARRLMRIADQTKGRAFVDVAPEAIQGVLNTIDSDLNCDVDIDTDADVLSDANPVDDQTIELLPDARTCDIDVSWGDDGDDVEPEEIAFLDEDGDVTARVTRAGLRRVVAKPGKPFRIDGISLQGRRRGTFFGLRIAGSTPSTRLRVRYRAAKLKGKGADVTSQVTQSRRRQVKQPRRRG